MPLGELPSRVTVYEVGPRDGLQNERETIPTEAKVRFIDLLSAAELPFIEITSFVRPGVIPQLSDAEQVASAFQPSPGIVYTALVPNRRGLERARRDRLGGIALFTAASETFSRKNTNASIADTIERFRPVVESARAAGLWIRGYVSTAFGCPYEGAVPLQTVVQVCTELDQLGVNQLAVSDTIGVATPRQVADIVEEVARVVPRDKIALHFHDTRGTALANVLAGLESGVTTFDSAAGGLGGCPYAPGATGNLATEDLVYMLDGLGIYTGASLDGVVEASTYLAQVRGSRPPSRYYQAAVA